MPQLCHANRRQLVSHQTARNSAWRTTNLEMKPWRMFSEGEMDFTEVLGGLEEISYRSGVPVELSQHSHDAVETARKSIAFLRDRLGAIKATRKTQSPGK